MKLLTENKIGYKNEKLEITWEIFEQQSNIIIQDIKKRFFNQKVCLLGVARGALPLLTYISHQTGIRDISIIQLKMTNSDQPFDYGNVSILLQAIRDDYQKFIILEDIIYKGKTVERVFRELMKKNKQVLAIYSLIIDEKFQNNIIDAKVNSTLLLKSDKWVKFPWEKK